VTITYYDPLIGAGIERLITKKTKVVFTESPGSQTFEVQDMPAIAAAAHAAGAVVILDNTWATPLYYKSFAHGADVSIQAATKYIVGHADAMLGAITMTEETAPAVAKTHEDLGLCPGPEDVYLGLRGLRSLGVRLERHQQSGLELARWLAERPEVERVLHPALPSHPSHALWTRDFTGASGLFSIVLKPVSHARLAAMLDGLELFGMGYSWGGFESLILPFDPRAYRTATTWQAEGPAVRLHVGLEDVDDLKADLDAGFARLRA
ncbi:MAG: cystathionine beta-lyase, partial [Methyloceanibacter sp.]